MEYQTNNLNNGQTNEHKGSADPLIKKQLKKT